LEFYKESDERLWFEPFYSVGGFNPNYDNDAAQYRWIGEFICDLGLELCRSANAICDQVIADFDPLYRSAQGLVIVTSRDPVFGIEPYRAEYRQGDRRYDTLRDFAALRQTRDVSIGSGFHTEAAERLGI
jgi:hypothetical protein